MVRLVGREQYMAKFMNPPWHSWEVTLFECLVDVTPRANETNASDDRQQLTSLSRPGGKSDRPISQKKEYDRFSSRGHSARGNLDLRGNFSELVDWAQSELEPTSVAYVHNSKGSRLPLNKIYDGDQLVSHRTVRIQPQPTCLKEDQPTSLALVPINTLFN